MSVYVLQRLVAVLEPDAKLRDRRGLDVRVGKHKPPQGGAQIRSDLTELLEVVDETSPYVVHQRYERLHPFTDGNGRSGRMLWLWQHARARTYRGLGFLHQWYYESLEAEEAAPS